MGAKPRAGEQVEPITHVVNHVRDEIQVQPLGRRTHNQYVQGVGGSIQAAKLKYKFKVYRAQLQLA